MSSTLQSGVRRLVFVTCLGVVAPATARAQQSTPNITDEQLIRRIESLVPEYESARTAREARVQALREAERAVPLDTVQIGPLRVVTLPGDVDRARALFEDVWNESFPGLEASPSLARHLFTFQWRARVQRLAFVADPNEQVVAIQLSRARVPTADRARVEIRDALSRSVLADFPSGSPMSAWLTARGYPRSVDMYRIVALANVGATRQCLSGDAGACGASLGIGFGEPGAETSAWFEPRQRLEMVQRVVAQRGRLDADDAFVRGCTDLNDVAACDALLGRLDWVPWVPVSDRLRTHALWLAVSVGGSDAWGRALERADAPVVDVLEHVSGLSIQEFLTVWRDELISNRPDARAGFGGQGSRVLVWSLIFMAFAMRSTRWRLA
jgi:hypothetical protein